MARKTIQIPLEDKFGYVDGQFPNTVYTVTADGEYKVTRGGYHGTYLRYFFCRISDGFPEALKYQRLYDLKAVFQIYFREEDASAIKDLGSLYAYSCGDFDPRTLTFNTKPSLGTYSTNWTNLVKNYTQNQWKNAESFGTYGPNGGMEKLRSSATKEILKKKNLALHTLDGTYTSLDKTYNKSVDYPDGSCYASVKSRLVGGGLPYIIVEYDDEETVTGKVVFTKKPTGQIDQGIDTTIEWKIQAKSYTETDWLCLTDVWEQGSAIFYWREQGASVWNEISIPDGTTQLVIPARTFGSNKTYEYYLKATDVAGGESETATYTFTTPGSQISPINSPTSGYVNPRNPTTFGWAYSTGSGSVAGGATTLHYRETGAQEWTDVTFAAGVYSTTIAANTFSTLKTYEWYLSGEDTYGYASTSPTYTFSTSAAQISSTPLAPINTIENKNEIIHFEWEFTSDDSASASRCILQYKHASDGSWNEIVDLTGNITEYDVPAYTFDAGAIEWQVVPYNIDGVLGTTTSASFISYGAPLTPAVYTDSVPFLTIRWQAEEQESYQIMVDDSSYGPYFGTEKRFVLPSYLEDGQHTVKIRTMGVYGLWSKWGEATVQIENQPGEAITMQVQAGRSASLSWETEEETSDFLIYRDGKLIGRTDKLSFTDRFALGEHVYVVVNRLPNGNYSKSSEVTGISVIALPCIVAADSEDWIDIQFSLKSSSNPSYDESVDVVYSHLSGNTFPSAFLSNYQETVVSHSAVFLMTQLEEQRKFMALKGKQVILKLLDGSVVIGIMEKWTRKPMKSYWMSFEFSLRQAEWEDYIDDTQ